MGSSDEIVRQCDNLRAQGEQARWRAAVQVAMLKRQIVRRERLHNQRESIADTMLPAGYNAGRLRSMSRVDAA
jgi:hypothetical protein